MEGAPRLELDFALKAILGSSVLGRDGRATSARVGAFEASIRERRLSVIAAKWSRAHGGGVDPLRRSFRPRDGLKSLSSF